MLFHTTWLALITGEGLELAKEMVIARNRIDRGNYVPNVIAATYSITALIKTILSKNGRVVFTYCVVVSVSSVEFLLYQHCNTW